MPCLPQNNRAGVSEGPLPLGGGAAGTLTASLKSFCEEPSQASVHIIFTFSRNISGWKEEEIPPILEMVD